jgi:outer membrane protein TolC
MPRLLTCLALLFLTAVLVPGQSASPDTARVLTLEQAISEAQQNNRLIKIASQSVYSANDEILAAKVQRYPQCAADGVGLADSGECKYS